MMWPGLFIEVCNKKLISYFSTKIWENINIFMLNLKSYNICWGTYHTAKIWQFATYGYFQISKTG